jgi:hypothetical protein
VRTELIEMCVAHLDAALPDMARYSSAQRDATIADLGHIVDTLAAAVFVDDGDLFVDFVGWLGEVLASRRVPVAGVGAVLDLLAERLRDYPRAHRFLRAAPPALDESPRPAV